MTGPEGSSGTRKREHEVLAAGIDVFWNEGYVSASVAGIAERLGMLKGSLYYYVESKEDLLMRIIQTAQDEAHAILEEIMALREPALDRLRIFVERYVEWCLNNLEMVGLYFREWRNLSRERRQIVRDQRKVFERFVVDLISTAQDEGSATRAQDARTLTFFVMTAVNSTWTWYRREGSLTPGEVAVSYGAMAVATVTDGS